MLASFMLFVDFDAVSWEGVKFRGRACQRRDTLGHKNQRVSTLGLQTLDIQKRKDEFT
jgi:hypothetical protein